MTDSVRTVSLTVNGDENEADGAIENQGRIVNIGPHVYSLDDPSLLSQGGCFPAVACVPLPAPLSDQRCVPPSMPTSGGDDHHVETFDKPRRWTTITQVLNRHLDHRIDFAEWEEIWDEIEAMTSAVRTAHCVSVSTLSLGSSKI